MKMHLSMNDDGTMNVVAQFECEGKVIVENNAPEDVIKTAYQRACDLAMAQAFRAADEHTKTVEVEKTIKVNAKASKPTKLAQPPKQDPVPGSTQFSPLLANIEKNLVK